MRRIAASAEWARRAEYLADEDTGADSIEDALIDAHPQIASLGHIPEAHTHLASAADAKSLYAGSFAGEYRHRDRTDASPARSKEPTMPTGRSAGDLPKRGCPPTRSSA